MACVKCGSSWTTQHGADRASCPECCKLARCTERKAGRYADPTEHKLCVVCGEQFVAVGLFAIAKRKCCSEDCQAANRRASVREGVLRRKGVPSKPRTKKNRPQCATCGAECRLPSQRKYCSRKCFVDARNAGVQSWDRAAIVFSALVRPSNKARSSLYRFVLRCAADMHAYMRRADMHAYVRRASRVLDEAAGLNKLLMRATLPGSREMKAFLGAIPSEGVCPRCGVCFVSRVAAKFPHCSTACFKADRTSHECIRCGVAMEVHFSGGNVQERRNRPMCKRCMIHTAPSQRGKRGHKGRCLKFGVPYDPAVRSYRVFERDGFVCHLCNRRTLNRVCFLGRSPHPLSPVVDHHPYPLSAGVMGHEWGNVRCACWSCNSAKGARMDIKSGAFAAEAQTPRVGGAC
jgi:5-methylcytosine-specific restriction endonuclease McrA